MLLVLRELDKNGGGSKLLLRDALVCQVNLCSAWLLSGNIQDV